MVTRRSVVANNGGEHRLCDSSEVGGLIASMARRLAEIPDGGEPLCLVGVRTRGVPLAERLAVQLRQTLGKNVDVGAVDITLYRDDLGHSQSWPVLRGTDVPFDVDGAMVVLVDDVLYTGRTVRAALNAICDLGRPAGVRLAVLVDRGHRELPIQADVTGMTLPTDRRDRVRVRLVPVDRVDEIVTISALADASPERS
jgi:pyrimidine operon attenuation protein / uracil phosphoribosyltransferase